MHDVREGYEFFLQYAPGYLAGQYAEEVLVGERLAPIIEQIDATIENMLKFEGSQKTIDTLSGDIMEFWHAGTANIDAARQGLVADFKVLRSHGFGSVDIESKSRNLRWQVKYGANPKKSAKYQTITYGEAARNGSVEAAKLLETGAVSEHDSVYYGMGQIIPEGQLEGAKDFIGRRMYHNATTRPELVARDKHFLSNSAEGIQTEDCVRSTPQGRNESKKMAVEIRDGEFDPEEYGLTIENWVTKRELFKDAAKAGLTAAVISAVLKAAPEIIKAVQYLVETGRLDIEQVKKVGAGAVTGAATGFLVGTISAAAIEFCQGGFWGETLKEVNPHVIATVAVIAIWSSIQIACGRKTGRDFVDELIRDIVVSTCALIGGGITQAFIEIPVFGYLIGNLVGSIVGSAAYGIGKQMTIAFCVESGFTMFGLVEQDYELPDEVLQAIGAEVFEFEQFSFEEFQYEEFSFEEFSFEEFQPEEFSISVLRRGVIGVSKVGYVT